MGAQGCRFHLDTLFAPPRPGRKTQTQLGIKSDSILTGKHEDVGAQGCWFHLGTLFAPPQPGGKTQTQLGIKSDSILTGKHDPKETSIAPKQNNTSLCSKRTGQQRYELRDRPQLVKTNRT